LKIRFPEIHLRAIRRIGELSRELEKAERQRDEHGRLLPNDGKQAKSETLAAAGISTSTAHRYEQLAGPIEEQAQQAANADRRGIAISRFAAPEPQSATLSRGRAQTRQENCWRIYNVFFAGESQFIARNRPQSPQWLNFRSDFGHK